MIDPSRINHKLRRINKMMPDEGSPSNAPLVSIVAPDSEPEPPHRFESEEGFRDYFGQGVGPTLVIFPPASEAPEPDGCN